MHKRRSKHSASREEKLQLSAMVDVVFLLLIFFVVTMKVDDVLASLPVSKPGTVAENPVIPPPPMLKIRIMPDGYYANTKRITLDSLEKSLMKISKYSNTQDIIIICSEQSEHSQLVRLLDTCSKTGFTNLHLFSQ
jgi:biopolymer transport protein ExbD